MAQPIDLYPAYRPPTSESVVGGHSACAGGRELSDIVTALRDGPLAGFDMGATAIVGPAGVEGRVWLRADGRTYSLTTLDASLVALLLRLEAFRAADTIADALITAATNAEGKVEAIHRWSGRVRPVDDGE